MAKIAFILISLISLGTLATASYSQVPEKRKSNVAIFVYQGATVIDYAGPYAVFSQAYFNGSGALNVYTVAETSETILTDGLRITPKFSFENAPKPDLLVIPGGSVSKIVENPRAIAWIAANAADSKYVLSVCSGAFIAAKAGLLDGLVATTLAPLIENLKAAAPKTRVVSDKRFVDNGKIIVTAGLSSRMDGALYMISKSMGSATAQQIANSLEYNWDPKARYVRAQLADFYFLNATFELLMSFPATPKASAGNRDQWGSVWEISTGASAREISDHLSHVLDSDDKWAKASESLSANIIVSRWEFNDEHGHAWTGTLSVRNTGGEENKVLLSLEDYRLKGRAKAIGHRSVKP